MSFSSGECSNADELAEKKQKIDDIRAEIARLNDQIKDINDEWFITSGHGSKSYTDETILPSPNKL